MFICDVWESSWFILNLRNIKKHFFVHFSIYPSWAVTILIIIKKSFAVIKKEREIAAAVVNHAIWVLKAYGNKILENGNKLKDLLTTILRAYAITDKGENAVIVVDLLSGSSCKMYTPPSFVSRNIAWVRGT